MKKYFEFNKPFRNFLPIFLAFLVVIVLLGSSYALLKAKIDEKNSFHLNVKGLKVTYRSGSEYVILKNPTPKTDKEGMSDAKDFIVIIENTSKNRLNFNLLLNEIVDDTEFANVMRYTYKKGQENYAKAKNLMQDNYIDQNVTIDAGESVIYRIKIWMGDANDSYLEKNFKAKVSVEVNS